jgi:ABC-2 type transport system ATP-binding protein
LIRDLAGSGTTILLTTHYLDEAEVLADRVGVIAAGRLIAAETPAELGGRASSAVTVSWLTPDGPRSERTETPTAFIRRLATDFHDGEIPGLTVTRPTLEDVYLTMIGTQE